MAMDEKKTAALYSSEQPAASDLKRLADFLLEKYHEPISIGWKKDPDVTCGFRLVVGSDVYDWNKQGRLRQLQDALLSLAGDGGDIIPLIKDTLTNWTPTVMINEIGTVTTVGDGIATVSGLDDVTYGEILLFSGGVRGMALDLRRNETACILFDPEEEVCEGSTVKRTGRVAGVPVGDAFLGRVVDPLGVPIDGLDEIIADGYRPVENEAPAVIDRQPVNVPLETGILAIDSMFPIGRGQRELIIGDRQTGKSTIILDTIINQKDKDVICIYVAIGQKTSTVARLVDTLKKHGAMDYYTAIGDLDFDNGVVVKGTSCTVNIAPNQLYHFRVVAANNGGCSFPTEVLSVEYVPQSEKTVLIVNGFHRLSSPAIIDTGNQKGFDLEADAGITYGRMAGWAGRQTVFDNSRRGREGEGALGYCGRELEGKFIAGNEFNYVREHATAIHTAHKYNIVSCSSEAFETGKVKLGGIDCIDLVLGLEKDDGHSLLLYKAFSQDVQKRLRSFVRDHGSLLVSGSFVGSDMSTESEQRFLADVLKLHLNGSQQGNKDGRVQGLGMTFDTWRTLNETHYAATAPDVLSPTSLASCVMKYSDGQSAAVAYSGRDYRCLTVGFPLECITDRRSRDAIMRGILNYLVK